ncbi:hypothetical protein [uncultured Deinococcus sp.]|uniref:hypothetical protein n=1 Tax=uncultured Deinococcus sp. TaxID=158789 RepID=UPI002585C1F0|nr:hypothetical protein [uncultured Deinococcus sp.]
MLPYSFIPDVLTEDLRPQAAALLGHPLWRAVQSGTATRAHLRTFALQDAWLVGHSRQLEALLLAHAPDERARTALLGKWTAKQNFSGPEDPGHLLHFGRAFGLTEAEFAAAEPLPGCAALTMNFYYALAHDGFLGLLASVAASESVFIAICDLAGPALVREYGLTPEQVAFFPLHDGLKAGVDGGEAALLRELALTPQARETVTRTVRRTYACEKLFYDTVYAVTGPE